MGYWPVAGAHYPERGTSLFSCNGVFTSRVIFRYAFPAKLTVSGYVHIEVWVKKMVAKFRCFCYCIPVFHLSFSIIPIIIPYWSSHNSMSFICTFRMCKWSSGIPLIHFSVCEFFRLNPRFVSFSRAFAMVKETFKRIQKKWKGLIWSRKGWSKK